MMREIIRMIHGSHLYGTNVPTSDLDYKAIYIPDGRDILLQRVRPSLSNSTSKERNLPGQEDVESLSLQQFLKLLCQGQTIALDMVFAPEKFWLNVEPEWYCILRHRERFLSRQVKAFVGYCRGQARKYAVKIERFRAMENVTRYFNNAMQVDGRDPHSKVSALPYLGDFVAHNYDSSIEIIDLPNGRAIPHLSVCDTKVPVTATLKEAYAVYSKKFGDYGTRVSHSVETNQQDWKSMMHAVRVANQAVEFLTTGKIVFPRPEADFLLKIRQGEVSFEEVSELIDTGLVRVEEALERTALPEKADGELADELVSTFYRSAVIGSHPV